MAEDDARRRNRRVFVSFQCKSVGAAGSSFAKPKMAGYMEDLQGSAVRQTVIVDGSILLPGNLSRHLPDIVAPSGSVWVTSSVRQASDFDIDLAISVPHHGSLERAPVIEVPSSGETILSYVCKPDCLEAMLGCLEQNFRRRATKRGLRAAQRYYWFQVARAVISFGLDALYRLDLLWGLLDKLKF